MSNQDQPAFSARDVFLQDEARREEEKQEREEARAEKRARGEGDDESYYSESESGEPAPKQPRGSLFGAGTDDAPTPGLPPVEQMILQAQHQVAEAQTRIPGGPSLILPPGLGDILGMPNEPKPGADHTPRPGSGRTMLCKFFEATGQCRSGNDCQFAHGIRELDAGYNPGDGRIQTTQMDFSKKEVEGRIFKVINIPEDQCDIIMTPRTEHLLISSCGITSVTWEPHKCRASIYGSEMQVQNAVGQMQRVVTHCLWGLSEPKLVGILRPRKDSTTARLRLSPMHHKLKECNSTLTLGKPTLTIGTVRPNDLIVKSTQMSRNHAQMEFQPSKGLVYVLDTSTNGTFLNGKRLPPRASAKVVLWHGDELLFHDPAVGDASEFGYIVNIEIF